MADPATEIFGLLKDRGVLQTLGREIAAGMKEGGNASYFSPQNTTGSGVAGGRGSSEQNETAEIRNSIRTRQLEVKTSNELFKNYKALGKVLKDHKKNTEDTSTRVERFGKVFGDIWEDTMNTVSKSKRSETKLVRQLNHALGGGIKTIDDVIDIRKEQLKLEESILTQKEYGYDADKETIERHKELSEALRIGVQGVESGMDTFINTLKRGVRGFFSVEAAVANFGIAMAQGVNDYRAQLRFGSQMGVVANQMAAAGMGIDPGAYTEMNAQARQASLTFGSLSEWNEIVSEQQTKYFGQIGDTTEAAAFATRSFQMLGKAGIRPTVAAMDSLGDSFKTLNGLAGVTSDQFSELMTGLIDDSEIQAKLRAARSDERQAIVAGLAERMRERVAMGMTVEQATEAARALGKLAGGGAKERFKQAAMLQTSMGAMGIAGGGEAAELVRLGQRRTAAQNAQLEGYMQQVANASTEAKRGSYGGEFMVDTLLDKSGMGQYLGTDSPFVTTMTEALKPTEEHRATIEQSLDDGLSVAQKTLLAADITANFFKNGAFGKIIMAGAQLTGAMVVGGQALGRFGGIRAGGGAMGGIRGMVMGQGMGGATGVAKFGRGLGMATRALGVAGAAVGAFAIGMQIGTQMYEQWLEKSEWFQEGSDSFFGTIAKINPFDQFDRAEMSDLQRGEKLFEEEMSLQNDRVNATEAEKMAINRRMAEIQEEQLAIAQRTSERAEEERTAAERERNRARADRLGRYGADANVDGGPGQG